MPKLIINSKPVLTAVTLSGYPTYGSGHGVAEMILVWIHPSKTSQQYPVLLSSHLKAGYVCLEFWGLFTSLRNL